MIIAFSPAISYKMSFVKNFKDFKIVFNFLGVNFQVHHFLDQH